MPWYQTSGLPVACLEDEYSEVCSLTTQLVFICVCSAGRRTRGENRGSSPSIGVPAFLYSRANDCHTVIQVQ
jgi:hypothetical protein